MPDGLVRPARAEDLAAVSRIVRAAYGNYVERLGKPPGPMLDDYARRIRDGTVWVIQDGGAVAGLLVMEDADEALLLDNIAVDPAAQGKGLGRRLMHWAEAEARRRGYAAVRLYTHVLMTENVALYTRAGYVETGRVQEHGFDRVYMSKAL